MSQQYSYMTLHTDLNITILAVLHNNIIIIKCILMLIVILNTHTQVSLYLHTLTSFLDHYNCGLFLSPKSLVRFTSNLWYLKIKGLF